MTEKLVFSRSDDSQTLQRITEAARQRFGLLARISPAAHRFAADKLRQQAQTLHFTSGKSLLDCHNEVRALPSNSHLVFLCAAQIAGDVPADVELAEDSE